MCRKFTIKVCNLTMESSISSRTSIRNFISSTSSTIFLQTEDVGLSILFQNFEDKLSNYLERCRTVAVNEKEFHWDTIRSFVRLHINELKLQKNASIFCNYVIELLLAFDCPSKFFVSRIIDIYCLCNFNLCFESAVSSRISNLSENQRLTFILRILKSRTSMYTRDSFSDLCREDYAYTLKGIKKGNMKFMRLLLKYDCTSISSLSYYPDITREYSVDIIKKFVWKTRLTILGDVFLDTFSVERFLDEWSTMSWPDCEVPKPSLDRVILILTGVDAMLGKLPERKENSEKIDCFRLYVESTSYPFLTLPEFRGFVIALSRFLRLERAAMVDRMCDTFREAYPECDAFYQPRTLKNLCRCGVRRSYRKYGSLPCTLQKLRVPTTLKKYILFQ